MMTCCIIPATDFNTWVLLMDQCGNYFIEDVSRLGDGTFGEVFEAKVYNASRTSFKIYARKRFAPGPEIDSHLSAVADLRQRFAFEIKKQCEFNRLNYDAIAPIVLFKIDCADPYFVMEKADCNLAVAIKLGLTDTQRIKAITDITSGLNIIHSHGYVHRDLKPQNILCYPDGNFKITDFGLLKDLDKVRAEIKTRFNPKGMGTPGYIAPEIDDSGIFSVESDIYAMGKVINDIYRNNLTPELSSIISKCCNFLPEQRYRSASELTREFLKAVGVNQ